MVSFVVVVLYLLAAIAAPFLVNFGVLDPFDFHQELTDPSTGGIPIGRLGGVSWEHPLGVEPATGRDVLSRLWYGVTFSLAIALSADRSSRSSSAPCSGSSPGSPGAGPTPSIGRFIDLTLSFPVTLMLLALSSIGIQLMADLLPGKFSDPLPNGAYVVIVLGAFGWPGIARIIRGQVLTVREREFVDAAVLLGASRSRIYFKEILPNLWAPLLVTFTLTMPAYISAEAALSYLGSGSTRRRPPSATC